MHTWIYIKRLNKIYLAKIHCQASSPITAKPSSANSTSLSLVIWKKVIIKRVYHGIKKFILSSRKLRDFVTSLLLQFLFLSKQRVRQWGAKVRLYFKSIKWNCENKIRWRIPCKFCCYPYFHHNLSFKMCSNTRFSK